MKAYVVSAKYAPFVEAQLRTALRSIALDEQLRSDAVLCERQCVAVPDQFIDATATGKQTILFGIGREDVTLAVVQPDGTDAITDMTVPELLFATAGGTL